MLTVNTMKHSFRLIIPLNLTLPCFLLDFGEKIILFYSFLQQMNSVRPTRVVCFAWGFSFKLGRAEMITKWSLQFRLKEKGNQSNIPLDKQRKKSNSPVSKFMRCLKIKN